MECKLKKAKEEAKRKAGINRYIMECKLEYAALTSEPIPKLIDTLWNVNFSSKMPSPTSPNELIDTLWNVNTARPNWGHWK